MTITESAISATKAVLAKCAANDPWFPQPAEATILAWAEQFITVKLPVDDLLAAVTRVYATSAAGFKPLPADIIRAARAIRADRAERESDAERDARREAFDRKVLDRTAIAAIAIGPTKVKTPRLAAAETAMQCAVDRHTAQEAIREYFAAKREANKAA